MSRLLVLAIFLGCFANRATAQAREFYEAFPAYAGGRVTDDFSVAELCKWENIFLGRISDADFAVMRYVPVQSYDGRTVRCFQKRIADILTCADAYNYARALRYEKFQAPLPE